jgi:hypothetical protein
VGRWNEDLSAHPDTAENRRQGFRLFHAVREVFEITPDDVLLAKGGIARWYAPIAHRELPEMISKLKTGKPREILSFAHTYGDLGYPWLQTDPAKMFYIWPDGNRTQGGSPINWINAHAETIALCLELSEAIQQGNERDAVNLTRHSVRVGLRGELDDVSPNPKIDNPIERARAFRRQLINPNITGIHRALHFDTKTGTEGSVFTYTATIEAAYWHLANLVDGGIVKRCERPGCGALFIQTHGRQRHCPPRWRQRESACALWVRQNRPARRKG